jgi:hypothetical protein
MTALKRRACSTGDQSGIEIGEAPDLIQEGCS